MVTLLVADLLQERQKELELSLLAGARGIRRQISVSEINRPGLALTGYLDYFPAERVQIMGLGEHTYLSTMSPSKRLAVLEKVFAYKNAPCVVITRGIKPHPEVLRAADRVKIPVLRSGLTTAHLIGELTVFLEEKLAPTTTIHGVMMSVYGLGVLLVGDSGIGKSECALELIQRGHMLVADDVVEVKQRLGGILFGTGAELIRHHMELRGLGIIDVQKIFGVSTVLDRTRIELVIRLEEWQQTVEYDRLGLTDRTTTILGVRVPEIVMPVRPGRNLAVLVEVATLNQRLKFRGQFTAKDFSKKLIAMMAKGSSGKTPGPRKKAKTHEKRNRRQIKDRLLFWIVTGMSGAGKSQAINCFEDFGFFCVDNLPVTLLPRMAELCIRSGKPLQRVALGIDVREGSFLHDLYDTITRLKKDGVDCRIVFLDADDKTLYRRFSETRRRHPLGKSVREGVREERRRLLKLKEIAHKIIDTSNMTLSELKETVSGLLNVRRANEMQLGVISFGYKYGLPADVDIIWDVRFLPNPNYVRKLHRLTGQDAAVKHYVLSNPLAQHFEKRFSGLILESLPHYMREGKSYLTVAVGCTGGRHRSVVMAEALRDYLGHHGFKVRVHHRDVDHD